MSIFALTLSPDVRSTLFTIVEMTFIVFVGVSFVSVAAYTARQWKKDQLFTRESVPWPLTVKPLSAWVFVICVMGLIYLQSALYAVVVLFGIAGTLIENRSSVGVQFGFDRVPPIKAMAWGLLIFGAVMLVETPLMQASDWLLDTLSVPHPEQQSVETFRQFNRSSTIFWFLLQAVFLFPVIEELFFRGYLLTFLKNYTSTTMAIVLSAGVFAFAHLNLGAALPLWFLGLVLGIAYEHTGSLLVPITIHACFNLATGLSLLLDKGSPS